MDPILVVGLGAVVGIGLLLAIFLCVCYYSFTKPTATAGSARDVDSFVYQHNPAIDRIRPVGQRWSDVEGKERAVHRHVIQLSQGNLNGSQQQGYSSASKSSYSSSSIESNRAPNSVATRPPGNRENKFLGEGGQSLQSGQQQKMSRQREKSNRREDQRYSPAPPSPKRKRSDSSQGGAPNNPPPGQVKIPNRPVVPVSRQPAHYAKYSAQSKSSAIKSQQMSKRFNPHHETAFDTASTWDFEGDISTFYLKAPDISIMSEDYTQNTPEIVRDVLRQNYQTSL